MCAALLGLLPGACGELEKVAGANVETECHLNALAGTGLTPTLRIDQLREAARLLEAAIEEADLGQVQQTQGSLDRLNGR